MSARALSLPTVIAAAALMSLSINQARAGRPDEYHRLPASADRAVRLLISDGLSSVYPVDFELAVVGTDSVEVDGRLLGEDEYRLDLGLGLLLLNRRPARWSVIRVSCAVLPLAVMPVYTRYREEELATEPVGEELEIRAVAVSAPADSLLMPAELGISGSKTIGISIGGPEGTGLNQATRLAVSGTVEGVRIDAELSDQSSPISPEGTTLELDELDIIRISLAGRNWQGSFGDVDFRLPAAGFGTLERRVVGGLVSGEFGPVAARVGYARPRGRYGRSVFNGIDGVQGPYVLAPDNRGARLVTGSEEVYLDGHRMTRGWDADYTVDYSTGELMFTGRNLIDRYRRIEASYQYVLEAWERTDVISGVEFGSGPVRLSADYFRESDDPARGGYYDLTPDELEYLAGIGSDSSMAWLDGGTQVDDSAGAYVRQNGRYEYVGEGRGNYRVIFSFVGDSLGDYVYDDSLLAHRYQGPGEGDYIAGYRVELPGRSELAKLELNLGNGDLRGGLVGLGRRSFVNLLAVERVADFDGALGGWADWQTDRLGLSYRGRALAHGFGYPGADSLVDSEYRWGGLRPEQARHVNELSGRYRPVDWLELGGDFGLLATADDSLVGRYVGRTRAGPVVVEGGRYGPEPRLDFEARPVFGRYRPRVGWRQAWPERAMRRSLTAGFGFLPFDGLELDIGQRWLRADSTDIVRSTAFEETGTTTEFGLDWRLDNRVRTSARVAYQQRRYQDDPVEGLAGQGRADWQAWLGSAGFGLTPRAGLRLQGDFQRSRRLVQLRDEYYRFVGPGEGSYSRDTLTGRYYFDPDGEYQRELTPRGSFIPADETALNLSGSWSAWRPLALTGSLTRTDIADSSPVSRLRGHNLRATVRALEPFVTAWLSATGSTSSDRTLVATGQENRRRRYRAEFQSTRLPSLETRFRAEYGLDDRWGRGGQVENAERSRLVSFEPVVGSRLRLEFEVGAEWSRISQPLFYPELGEFGLNSLTGAVGRNWSFGGSWRLRTRAGVVRRTATIEDLPFEVGVSRPLGLTPSGNAEVSHILSRTVTISGRYDFTNRPDRKAEHRFSAEMRAFF